MRNEADVKKQVRKLLKKYGVWYTMPHQAGFSQPGVPDFLCCVRGRFLGIETKFGKNGTTAMQDRQIVEIRAAGGVAMVVNDKGLETFESWLYTWLTNIEEG